MLKLAKIANIKRLVFFSVAKNNTNIDISLMKVKSEIQFIIRNARIRYTIFQLPGFFQGLSTQYALPMVEQQRIYLSNYTLPNSFSYINTEDVTLFCLKSLDLKSTENKIFAIVHPSAGFASKVPETCVKLELPVQYLISDPLLLSYYNRKTGSYFVDVFQSSWNIADRLSFMKAFVNLKKFNIDYYYIKKIFKVHSGEFLTIEDYYLFRIFVNLTDLIFNNKRDYTSKDFLL